MQFISLTDKGKLRTKNEDYCISTQIGDYTVLMLADGMGGANSGEVASTRAIEIMLNHLDENLMSRLSLPEIPQTLTRIINETNRLLYEFSISDIAYNGMGTTLEVCIIKGNTAYIAHVGDSRVYKITSSGEILQLTKDHSLIEYMIDAGTITREEAVNHPQRNVITKAIGTAPLIEADILSHVLEDGDVLLLCSDGLTNMVHEQNIALVATADMPINDRAARLIELANDAGGADNISVVLACN